MFCDKSIALTVHHVVHDIIQPLSVKEHSEGVCCFVPSISKEGGDLVLGTYREGGDIQGFRRETWNLGVIL